MISFSDVQEAIKKNVTNIFGSGIDLSIGSNSYLFYNTQAQNVYTAIQAQNIASNNLSIFTAQGNSLNNLGILLNYKNRPYYPFSLMCIITGTNGVSISAGLGVNFIDSNGLVYYFATKTSYTILVGTAISAEFFYLGNNQYPLQAIPAQSLSIVDGSATISGGTISDVSNTTPVTPILYSDPDFRNVLTNIYTLSNMGMAGAIQSSLNALTVIQNSKVYVGVNTGGTTDIIGVSYTYNLPYGNVLVIVNYATAYSAGAPIQYAYGATANAIFNRWNWDNKTFNPVSPPANQILQIVTDILGNAFTITFYTAIQTPLDAVLNVPSSVQRLNETQIAALFLDIQNYISNIPIAGTWYSSEVSNIALSGYGLIIENIELNSITNQDVLLSKPDEKFIPGTIAITYV